LRILVCLSIMLACSLYFSPASAFDACFQQAAAEYGVSPDLLRAISLHENRKSNPSAINRNANGTYDIGLMQINSRWAKKLGAETWSRITEPCVNIRVGAWILAQCVRDFGYSWTAVGCYHSRTPSKRDRYAEMISSRIYSSRTPLQQAKKETTVGYIASFSAQEAGNGLASTFQ